MSNVLKPHVREIAADLETPVSAFLKLRAHVAHFLLESVEQGERLGRFSFIGVDSLLRFRILPEYVITEGGGKTEITPLNGRNPLHLLRERMSAWRLEGAEGLPNLVGGAVGYLGYDFVRFLERLPNRPQDPLELPTGAFLITRTFVIFDHLKRKILLVSLDGHEAERRVEELERLLARPLAEDWHRPRPATGRARFEPATTRDRFTEGVKKAQEYIRAGDIFQVVLSQRERGEIFVEPFQVYRALRILNPSPYMFFIDFGDYHLVGSSPEVHAKMTGGMGLIRPIAGTRPRGTTGEQDRALERELLADEKERAEHLMLIDLARNDLGRSAEYGTVRVDDLYSIERYSHVMHIVSQVTGRLRPGVDAFDFLAATFPAGTVSGAPKVRAMEIVDELESVARGPYAGTVGYFSLSGDMDMCIAIRTIVIKGRTAYLQAGAGIVADSVPEREWEETCNKIAALKKAVEMAEEGI